MATQEKTWNVANRLHSQKDSDNPEVNHIIAGADEIYDDEKGAKQSDINAQTDAALADRYTKAETYSKEQMDSLITTPDVNYVSVVATNATTAVTDILPTTGEANTIYRVGNWNGTQYDPTMYALLAWNGTAYVCLAVRSFVGEVYDVSINHPDGQGNPTPYADLTAALGTDGANIPADIRRGGMRIQFIKGTVQSSENRYVQYRLMTDSFSTTESDWQGVDDEPTADSENLVKSGGVNSEFSKLKNLELTPYAYATTETLRKTKEGATTYHSILFQPNLETKVIVSGRGGADRRLWAIYNSQGLRTRVADSGADTIASPIELTLSAENDEKYVVVNVRTVALDLSYVHVKNLAEPIIHINEDLSSLGAAINSYTCTTSGSNVKVISDPSYILQEKGLLRIKFTNANTLSANVTLQIGDAAAKPLYYNGAAVSDTNTWSAEEQLIVYYDGTNYQSWSIERVNDLTTGGTKALTAEQGKILNGIVNTLGQNVNKIEKDVYKESDLTSDVSWTSGNFIKASDHLHTVTSSTNKVGIISIPFGFDLLKFNYSVKRGANYNKLGWYISDTNGNVLTESPSYDSNETVGNTNVVVRIPDNAVSLSLSWNQDLESSPYVIVSLDPSSLYERVDKMESLVDVNNKVVNIENEKAKAYLKTRYNNGDYGYTKFPYQDGSITSSKVDITLPNGAVIDTPVDALATTRHLEYADNPGLSDSKVVSLDLISTQYTIQNLEGNKYYYWRVYKDSSAENILASGSFRTEGHLRQIRIPANSNFDMPYIKNVRDIGGWQTEGGKRLRYGVLFRGSELNHDNEGTIVSYISQEGIDVLTELGVSAELDLRNGTFSESALGEDVAYAYFSADLLFYRLNVYNTITNRINIFVNVIRQIIAWIKAGKGIYAHCQGGCDRTGFLCAVIEGICGVSENDINLDYELSIRNRNRGYYSIYNGDNYDGDFKYAMEYIKGLKKLNNVTYTKVRCYKNSKVTINNTVYSRDNTVVNNDVKYCKWTDGTNTYYTTDIYPTSSSTLYDSTFTEILDKITATEYDFYYNAGAAVSSYTPVPITDTSIISALDAMPKPTLKEQFRLLMQVDGNGLTDAEMDEFEMYLVS